MIATGETRRATGITSDSVEYWIILSDSTVQLATEFLFGTPDFTLPSGITAIEANAFEGAAMTVVFVPDGCESIGDHAFRSCPNLIQIRIPANCVLGEDVFDGCIQVYVFGVSGSPAEDYCAGHENCIFVPVD